MPLWPIEHKYMGEAPRTATRRDSLRLRLKPARSIEETGLDPLLYGDFLSPHAILSPGRELWSKAMLVKPEGEHPMGNCSSLVYCAKSSENTSTPLTLDRIKKGLYGRGKSRLDRKRSKKWHSKATSIDETLETSEDVSIKCHEAKEMCDSELDMDSIHCKESRVEKSDEVVVNGAASDISLLYGGNYMSEAKLPPVLNQVMPTVSDELPLQYSFLEDSIVQRSDGCLESDWLSAASTISGNEGVFEARIADGEDTKVVDHCLVDENEALANRHDMSAMALATLKARKADARARWKRVAHTVTFINRMAANIRLASADLLEDKVMDEILQQQAVQDDAGGVGAAAFEGAQTAARIRCKGRTGMEGLLVRQNRGVLTFCQDFYVACLKMSLPHFLIGVFLAPVALGLLFTPLYILDADGLFFDGLVPEDATTSPLVSAKQRCLAFLNIFLYALSLSTTFGGSPVVARSPFTLLVANVNTLLAQFLFVFLSGAVFARMSQPSYPICCSKKAIIKTDDLSPVLGIEQAEKFKAFAVRLVLTGPPPCELVDVKICLTFRLFVKLPSGSVFCSTQDLEVVRPEVSYLRYGLMVRHIIDKKSPVYGHTMETLHEGDASFSLTVMGTERTSMQPVFHLEDYFVHDGDVVWEGDYVDFIHINETGQRVLDHSQIDLLKPVKCFLCLCLEEVLFVPIPFYH